MDVILDVKNVSLKTPEGRSLFSGLSFQLGKGELLQIIGYNGSGKSTFLKAILGQYLHFDGDIALGVGLEKTSLLPQMGNIQFLLPFSLRDVIHTKVMASDNEVIQLGLLNKASLDLAWNTASGGERQKALLTRCLLSSCELLVLDEPFNHLDSSTKDQLVEKILHFKQAGMTVVLNSHESSLSPSLPSNKINLQDYIK